MTIKDITAAIEEIAPLSYAEGFDNVGLLVGAYDTEVSGVLVTLDTLEKTVDEAIASNCNLIVSFHPIIFSGLKKINGNSYVERVVIKAIQNNIAIYATHTALDNSFVGVNARICDTIGLVNKQILIPQAKTIKKLTTYAPMESAQMIRKKLFEVGAGNIGNYENCSFNTEGIGTYKGNEFSNPAIGEKGVLYTGSEEQINITFEKHKEKAVIKALLNSHPYEEVAYEITALENNNQHIGMGMLGEFEEAISEKEFIYRLKENMNTPCIRHSQLLDKKIKKVAVLGGSGSFAIQNAIVQGADAFVSADFKYHDFYQAENQILLTDIGHYESEQFTKNLLVEFLTKKFPNFAILLSEESTNPIYYS